MDEAVYITSVLTEVSDSFSNHGNNAEEEYEGGNKCAGFQMLLLLWQHLFRDPDLIRSTFNVSKNQTHLVLLSLHTFVVSLE